MFYIILLTLSFIVTSDVTHITSFFKKATFHHVYTKTVFEHCSISTWLDLAWQDHFEKNPTLLSDQQQTIL